MDGGHIFGYKDTAIIRYASLSFYLIPPCMIWRNLERSREKQYVLAHGLFYKRSECSHCSGTGLTYHPRRFDPTNASQRSPILYSVFHTDLFFFFFFTCWDDYYPSSLDMQGMDDATLHSAPKKEKEKEKKNIKGGYRGHLPSYRKGPTFIAWTMDPRYIWWFNL